MSTEKKQQKTVIKKKDVHFSLIHPEGEDVNFLSWGKDEKGNHSYLLLKKQDETALLFTGEGVVVESDVRKLLMKLTNEGWEQIGEVDINYDGRSESLKSQDDFYSQDAVKIEIGRKLLPLVDPGAGAPLLDTVSQIRKDIVRETGYVVPGIRVVDNLNIPLDNYIIYIKETPVASGEIYLDRFLAMGEREKLMQLKGWSTKEPVFNHNAVWVEPGERNKAEDLGCILMGPLNILITHLREAIIANLRDLLGLQDVHAILTHLRETHPIVVEDFLEDKKKLRLLRKVLLNLVAERVSIRDMVTILETVSDYEDQLEKTDMLTEMVRIALSRQICWNFMDHEGTIKALNLSRELEEKIQTSIKETRLGLRLVLTSEEVDSMLRDLRQTLEDYKHPRVIFCDPPTRLYYRRLTETAFPGMGILSTAEIARGIPIEILGEIELPESVSLKRSLPQPEPAKDETEPSKDGEKDKDKKGGFWSLVSK